MMQPTPTPLVARQLWNIYSSTNGDPQCTGVVLPASGVISIDRDTIITLTHNAVFQPLCTTVANTTELAGISPFYASSTPQVYVVAAATVLAWVLVLMLVISPRNFTGTLAAGPAVGKGIIAGAQTAAISAIGLGSRPWLQKAAALTVAVALTIATADTFRVSERFYPAGIDGDELRSLVENSLEIRITRLISDIFVWLAQVQTLIRLFPRHKEKVLIKWIGFALIILDSTFSALNSFFVDSPRRPRDFIGAIPALAYLFELSLSLLYAAWVIYYAFSKRRYAFYHPKMKSNVLIALVSLVSILTPVVFFVTDITLEDVAGWGDYFRWVGGAAASVVVWEWVERIEVLERDEKKDGILGREIFDGDEMIGSTSTRSPSHNRRRRPSFRRRPSSDDPVSPGSPPSNWARRFKPPRFLQIGRAKETEMAPVELTQSKELSSVSYREGSTSSLSDARSIQRPIPTATPNSFVCPPSRTETTSAASTVYIVRQDGGANVQPVRRRFMTPDHAVLEPTAEDEPLDIDADAGPQKDRGTGWHGVANRFKRKRTAPPAEVRAAIQFSGDDVGASTSSESRSMRDYRNKFRGLASRGVSRSNKPANPETELPWTVIPAPARGTTWSPNGATRDQPLSDINSTRTGSVSSAGQPHD